MHGWVTGLLLTATFPLMTDKIRMLAEDTETTWNYCKYHIGEWAEMYTTDKIMMRRYETFAQKYHRAIYIIPYKP